MSLNGPGALLKSLRLKVWAFINCFLVLASITYMEIIPSSMMQRITNRKIVIVPRSLISEARI